MGGGLALACLGLGAPSAGAQPRRRLPLRLALEACLDVVPGEVRRIVAVELRGALADPALPDRETTRAEVRCEGSSVALRVDDPITGKELSRTLELAGTDPRARPRLLALAVVELVAASWTELASNPTPVVPPARPPEGSAARRTALQVAEERDSRRGPTGSGWSVALGGRGQVLARNGLRLWGGEVRLAVLQIGPWSLGLGGRALLGGLDRAPAGRVLAERYEGFLGVGLGAQDGAFGVRGGLEVAAGAGVLRPRVSAAYEANPAESPVVGLVGGPAATLTGCLHVDPVVVELRAEVGVHIWGIRATLEDVSPVTLEGVWLAATLSVGLSP
ncbi:MAG: hypothetical protein ACFCGT_14585 [Sandaracinaceae bacterium]